MKSKITPQMHHMTQEFHKYGPAFVSPEWEDSAGIEGAVERRAEEMISNADDWCELFERAACSKEGREAMVDFMNEQVAGYDPHERAALLLKYAMMDVATAVATQELEQ